MPTKSKAARVSSARPVAVCAREFRAQAAADALAERAGRVVLSAGCARCRAASRLQHGCRLEHVKQHCLLLPRVLGRLDGDRVALAAGDPLHGLEDADNLESLGGVSGATLGSFGLTHGESRKGLGTETGTVVNGVLLICHDSFEQLGDVPHRVANGERGGRLVVRHVGRLVRAEIERRDRRGRFL